MGSLRVGHDWATSLSLFTSMHWRRQWQPTPVFLPGESQGRGTLVGCCLWGRTVGHDWSDLAAVAAASSASCGKKHSDIILTMITLPSAPQIRGTYSSRQDTGPLPVMPSHLQASSSVQASLAPAGWLRPSSSRLDRWWWIPLHILVE